MKGDDASGDVTVGWVKPASESKDMENRSVCSSSCSRASRAALETPFPLSIAIGDEGESADEEEDEDGSLGVDGGRETLGPSETTCSRLAVEVEKSPSMSKLRGRATEET